MRPVRSADYFKTIPVRDQRVLLKKLRALLPYSLAYCRTDLGLGS